MDFVPEGSVGFKVDPFRHLKYCLRLWAQRHRLVILCYFVFALKLFGFVSRTIFILKSMSNVEMLLEVSATYPIPLLAIAKLAYLLCRPSRVHFLLSTVETHFWNLRLASVRLRSYWDKRFLVINFLLLGHCLLSNAYVVLHLAFPYIPVPEGRTRWLPTLISIPFNTDESPLHEILYVILSWNMFISVFGNGLFDFLFVYAAQHLCAQFAVLKNMLKKLDFGLLDHHNDVEKFNSKTFQREVHNRLVVCIKHHSMLLSYSFLYNLRKLLLRDLSSYSNFVVTNQQSMLSFQYETRRQIPNHSNYFLREDPAQIGSKYPTRMNFIPKDKIGIRVDPFRRLKYCLRLWRQRQNLLIFCYIIYALKLFGFVSRTILILKSTSDLRTTLELCATYPIPLLAVIKMAFLLSRYENVRVLFTTVETRFWEFSTGGRRLQKYWRKRFFVINSLLLEHFTAGCGYVILHLAFPYVPIPEGRTRWLPTLIAFPVNTDTSPVYEILYAILSWNMFVSVFGNAFFDLLFVYGAQHLCAQFMLLKAALKRLDFGLLDHHDDLERFKSKTFQREIHDRIVICINHHNLLLRYGRELKNLSSLIFGVQLLTTLLTLVMTGYTLSEDFEELTKSTMLLSFVFSSVMQFSIFAVQCADIHHQSASVAEAAFQCNWYLFNAKAKRGLTLLIMNSQKGISMYGAGIVVMNNRVLVKMAQKVFSCITLLRSLEQ